MVVQQIPRLKPASNLAMMQAIRDAASPAFQERIHPVNEANVRESMDQILNHRPTRNEFMDVLVNRIGMVTVRENSWTNPLGVFKKGMLNEGDTVEELALDLPKSYAYDHDRESMEKMLFGTHRVGAQASFHKINDQRMYAITDNPMQLRRAFLNSQGGIHTFQGNLLKSAITADAWDEYLQMTKLISLMNENGAFFNINVPDLTTLESSETEAKRTLKALRTYAGKLTFISRLYNPAGLPVAAPQERLVVITTPEFRAAVDVDALAGAFNMERAEVLGRVVVVQAEDIDIKGFQALITTEDFFQVYDTLLENASQWNPVTLSNNHFLHHHQIFSASRFVPALMFSTAPTTPKTPVIYTTTALSNVVVTDKEDATVTADLVRGEVYSLATTATTTPAGGKVGVSYGLTGNTDPMTFIRETGVLHVGPEEAGPLSIVAVAGDGSGVKSTAVSLTVDATTGVAFWPRDRDGDGLPDEHAGP